MTKAKTPEQLAEARRNRVLVKALRRAVPGLEARTREEILLAHQRLYHSDDWPHVGRLRKYMPGDAEQWRDQ